MKIRCLHGYFIFEETRIGQVSDFMGRFGLDLVPVGPYYTFSDLEDAPKYSLKGKTLLGNVALANFEGEPWEIFEENGLVYDFDKSLVVPIATILAVTTIAQAGNRFVSPGLIIPGSATAGGKRVKDYSAWFSRDTLRFLYSEVAYV
jgi:hypothetical protein